MKSFLRWAPCGADSPTWTPCDPRRGYDAGTFKQGDVESVPSHLVHQSDPVGNGGCGHLTLMGYKSRKAKSGQTGVRLAIRIASPDVAADCSFTQNDCSLNFTRSTILFSLTPRLATWGRGFKRSN